jgi:hypothetical protein
MIQTATAEDNVTVELYEVGRLRDAIPGWDDLEPEGRLEALEGLNPTRSFTAHNAVTSPYREHLSRLLHPEVSETPVDATHIAFGDDGTTVSSSDEHLGNETYRAAIDDHVDRSHEYVGTVLLGADDAVGIDLIEAGLVTEADPSNPNDMAVNRVTLDDPNNDLQPKDADHTVTVRIVLSYLDESEVI